MTKTMRFNASKEPATWFWSSGDAWGTILQRPDERQIDVSLRIFGGSLRLQRIILAGAGSAANHSSEPLSAGGEISLRIARS